MRNRRTIRGFTLTELLVAIVITALVVGFVLRAFVTTAARWQLSDQRIDTFREARAALHLLARDLGRADINGDAQMLILSDLFTVPPDPPFAKEAYAVTPIPNSGKSDLCTVGYYCSYDVIAHAYSLKRLFKNSDLTYVSLASASPDFTALYTKDSPVADDIAGAYVWDLQIRPGVGGNVVDPSSSSSSTWNWLEVRFKAMNPASGRKIRNTSIDGSTWFDPASPLYTTYILPHEQLFVTRIDLHQSQ